MGFDSRSNGDSTLNGRQRFALAFASSLAPSLVSFIVFFFCYIFWASWRYPHNNSMAGLPAFFYGLLLASFVALLTFIIVFAKLNRKPMSENAAAFLCYSAGWLTGIILSTVDKRNYVRLHAAQSTVAFGGLNILLFCLIPFNAPGEALRLALGTTFLSILAITLILWLVCMIKAGQGSRFVIPIVGRIPGIKSRRKLLDEED